MAVFSIGEKLNVNFLANELQKSDYKIDMSEACFFKQIFLQGDLEVHENTHFCIQPCIIFDQKITVSC